jgi:Sap, sulfolipid-1-addressing protein
VLLARRLHRRRPNTGAPAAEAHSSGARPAHARGAPEAGARASGSHAGGDGSKMARYLHSRRLAFALGFVLYVLPSPIYIGAVKAIADATSSTESELTWLLVAVAVMLWTIELPMLMLLVVPDRAAGTLERVNLWFAARGRSVAIAAALAVGGYLILRGIVQLS